MTLQDQLQKFNNQYAPSLLEDFYLYWAEPIQRGKFKDKERWQAEKTWHTGMRLKKWQRNQEKWKFEDEQKQKLKMIEEKPVQTEGRGQGQFEKIKFNN